MSILNNFFRYTFVSGRQLVFFVGACCLSKALTARNTKSIAAILLLSLIYSNPSYSRANSSRFKSSGISSLQDHLDSMSENPTASKHTVWDDSSVLKGGRAVSNKPAFAKAIGRIGGCTGTLVSPPDSPVTAVVLAAHCGGAPNFILGGKTYSGFTCITNKDFWSKKLPDGSIGSTDDDVGVCFSKEKINTGVHGCLSPKSETKVGIGDPLRIFGYGNPVVPRDAQGKIRPQPQVETLLSGPTFVERLQEERAIIAHGPAVVTPGDSGGPIIRESDFNTAKGNTFQIVGINSKYMAIGQKESSTFAPFDEKNMDFFKRAVERYSQSEGVEPKICGFNFKTNSQKNEEKKPKRDLNQNPTQPKTDSTQEQNPSDNAKVSVY
jgi:hypothetical protein